jgi:hypothetical protein
MSQIEQSCLLVDLRIRRWEAIKTDVKASDALCTAAGADFGSAKVRKYLLPDVKEHIKIAQISGSARNWLRSQTLPWIEGVRIVHVHKFTSELKSRMDAFEQEFDDAVDTFIQRYPLRVQRQQAALGDLFNPEDYPSQEQLKRLFKFRTVYLPVPTGDWRLQLEDEAQQDLAEQFEVAKQEQIRELMSEVRKRMVDRLRYTIQKLERGPDGQMSRFTSTLLPNLAAAVAEVRQFNITQDAALEALCDETTRVIHGLTSSDLKANPTLASSVASKLDAVAQTIPEDPFGF